MYKKFIPLLILLACGALASCDASFSVPDPVVKNDIPLVDLKTGKYPMTGYVLSSHWRCDDTLPLRSRIIVGWEIASYSQKAFYIYGTGVVNDTIKKIINYPPLYGYKLNVTIDSNLPQQVLFPDATSADIIAVGHLFLTTNEYIKNGDTLTADSFNESDDILGGVRLTTVIYFKGNPKLFGKTLNKIVTGKYKEGFNFWRTYNGFNPDPDRPVTNLYVSDPGNFYLNIEDKRSDTRDFNKFWLFQ